MEWVIEKLERMLSEEIIQKGIAEKILPLNEGIENKTIESYKESLLLANERIPQLETAIQLLRGNE